MEYTIQEKENITKAIEKYNFIKMSDDGVVEIYADHHMLNTLRTCEAKFELEILDNVIPKGRVWPLSFGIFFHQCMEWFDEAEDKNFTGEWDVAFDIELKIAKQWGVDILSDNAFVMIHNITKESKTLLIFTQINHATWIARCRKFWVENKLDEFNELPGYKELNGWPGAMAILMQYWDKYGKGQERFRTVGNELCFGRDKEVPILIDPIKYKWAPFRCYLTGRIDRVVDNGTIIGPMDRKTHRYLTGKELDKYKPHDAFVGYVYALRQILPQFTDKNGKVRKCNGVIVDMIQLKEVTDKTKNQQRFMRAYREYYDSEFVEFVDRQISSFAMLYQMVVQHRPAQWNTAACHNQFFRNCPYKLLHEQTIAGRESILNSCYQQREKRWTPFVTKDDPNLVLIEAVVE